MPISSKIEQQGLGAALRKLHRSYMRRLQVQLAEHGVSVAQYLALRALWEEAGMTQNDLAARLGIEKASSTAVIDALERDGLIDRVRDTSDRRKIRVCLSAEGEAVRGTLMPFAKLVALQASDGLSEPEMKAFFRVVGRMLANLQRDERGHPADPKKVQDYDPTSGMRQTGASSETRIAGKNLRS